MLRASDLHRSYDGAPVIAGLSLVLGPGDRIGLVGPNGSGKSTLLRLLAGDDVPDRGAVSAGPGVRVGRTAQEAPDPRATLRTILGSGLGETWALRAELDDLERRIAAGAAGARDLRRYGDAQTRYGALGGWAADATIAAVRRRLGIAELGIDTRLGDVSGGEQARALLAAALLGRPDVLLLDEPTNHLDIAGLEFLEAFLAAFDGALVVVSHDRRLLDRAVTRILELDPIGPAATVYEGGYSAYRAEKERRRARVERTLEAQDKRRRRLEADIVATRGFALQGESGPRRGRDHRGAVAKKVARKATARKRRLERELTAPTWVAKPRELPPFVVALAARPDRGSRVAALQGVSAGFDGRPVIRDVDLDIHAGDRVAIVGANGSGKSTLLGVLAGRLRVSTGSVEVVRSAGYLPQTHDHLPAAERVLGFFRRQTPMLEGDARTLLGHFRFEHDRMQRPIGTLSPGERVRLLLAVLVADQPELLLLDEPTNHLDFDAIDVVEGALATFPGTLVVVSHDRAFLETVGIDRRLTVAGGRVLEG